MIWGMLQIMLRGEFGWGIPAEFGMWPDAIVVEAPGTEDHPSMPRGGQQCFVQALVSQPALEAFVEPVLLRLTWRDVMPLDVAFL